MEFVALLLLLGGMIWLHCRLRRVRTELAALRQRLLRLEQSQPSARAEAAEEAATAKHAEKSSLTSEPVVSLGRVCSPATESPAPTASPPALADRPVSPQRVPSAPAARRRAFDWERFLGVKLFAWVGGFALFLAAAFFVKYSFDNNLISPAMRVAIGAMMGLGLVFGGQLLRKRDYQVTAQTLGATGVVILYAVSFAAHAFYHFTGLTAALALMTGVTALAFLLAVRMEARGVAVLGLVGGFLTPPLLLRGMDQTAALFGYVGLLNLGLLAVAARRRWHFLVLLGAIGTTLTEACWRVFWFDVSRPGALLGVTAGFNLLFLGAALAADRWRRRDAWLTWGAALPPAMTFLLALSVVKQAVAGERPAWFCALMLLADACWLAQSRKAAGGRWLASLGGGLSFLLLATWSAWHLREETLGWILGGYLLFGLLHSLVPRLPGWRGRKARPPIGGNVFPVLTLLLFLLPLSRGLGLAVHFWSAVFLAALLGVGLALWSRSGPLLLASGSVVFVLLAVHAITLPREVQHAASTALLIGCFGLLFLGGALISASGWMPHRFPVATAEAAGTRSSLGSSLMPFVLLGLVCLRLPLEVPQPVFAVTLALALILLAAGRFLPGLGGEPVALGGVLLPQLAWQAGRLQFTNAPTTLAWNLLFLAVFLFWPFVAWRGNRPPVTPWAAAALSPVLHCFLILDTVKRVWAPESSAYLGLIPAVLGAVMGLVVWRLGRQVDRSAPQRNALLAWGGASALFLAGFIVPVQFEREWLALGLALAGAAWLGLFHRVPHPGLRVGGLALLILACAGLLTSLGGVENTPRSGRLVFNGWLYTYGLAAMACFAGGRLLAPPRNRLGRLNVPPLLYGMGTLLAFVLLNLEIADYFSTGHRLSLGFTGHFARDMSYSIGWALFAITLLAVGVTRRQAAARFAGAGLLVVTLLKLFFHDLVNLAAPYRIGAFFGVAVVAILTSVLYQRFFARSRAETG